MPARGVWRVRRHMHMHARARQAGGIFADRGGVARRGAGIAMSRPSEARGFRERELLRRAAILFSFLN